MAKVAPRPTDRPDRGTAPKFLFKHNVPDLGNAGGGFHKPGDTVGIHELAGYDINHLVKSGALQPLGDQSSIVLLGANPSKDELLVEVDRLHRIVLRQEEQLALLSGKVTELEAVKPAAGDADGAGDPGGAAEAMAARIQQLELMLNATTRERDMLRHGGVVDHSGFVRAPGPEEQTGRSPTPAEEAAREGTPFPPMGTAESHPGVEQEPAAAADAPPANAEPPTAGDVQTESVPAADEVQTRQHGGRQEPPKRGRR